MELANCHGAACPTAVAAFAGPRGPLRPLLDGRQCLCQAAGHLRGHRGRSELTSATRRGRVYAAAKLALEDTA